MNPMNPVILFMLTRLRKHSPRAAALIEPHHDMLGKAASFAAIGVLNVVVDTSVFFLTYSYLTAHVAALRPLDALAQWCACTSVETVLLVTANVIAWGVAVSGSYVMNSFITFAAESGRRLNWRGGSRRASCARRVSPRATSPGRASSTVSRTTTRSAIAPSAIG